MATSSAPSESERRTETEVYSLGDAVVRFRHYAELNYARADGTADFGGSPAVPSIIDTCFGEVLDHALRVADASPVVGEAAQALIGAARSVRALIGLGENRATARELPRGQRNRMRCGR